MNIKKTIIAASIGLALAATAYGAAHSPISQRQAAMKSVGEQMRTLGGMAQGKTAYDDFAVFSAIEIMRDAAITARPLFPVGSDIGEKNRAKPEIWAADSNFDTLMGELIASLDATLEADPADLDSFMPLFMNVAGSCKSCHEKYRAPEN